MQPWCDVCVDEGVCGEAKKKKEKYLAFSSSSLFLPVGVL